MSLLNDELFISDNCRNVVAATTTFGFDLTFYFEYYMLGSAPYILT